MGCSASKSKDEEAIQLCKDRRNFIKQAVEQRTCFASGHVAYLHALRRVSLALHNFVDGEEHHDFLLDTYSTPPFTPVKRLSPQIISVPLKPFTSIPNQSEKSTVHVMRYLRSNANPSVSVEEWPQSPQTVRIDSYYPSNPYGIDGFFAMETSQMNSSFYPSPNNRPAYPPPSPQNSQWDSFWNPFSSLDTYGYPSRITSDDEMARLRRVREEEGIPELEEDDDDDGHIGEEEEEEEDIVEEFIEVDLRESASKIDAKPPKVTIPNGDAAKANNTKTDTVHEMKGLQSQGAGSIEVAKEQKAVELEVTRSEQAAAGNRNSTEETPGFTVYVNRRPTSMREVMKEIKNQFVRICDCAHEVSSMLEASRAQYSSTSSELTASRRLNPVALFHSASSRSMSSRFFLASSSSREYDYDSNSDYSEESSMISGSHQSTLDRLYAWEKKLYEEVKCGERTRVAYEKKCAQLRNQDVTGDEPSSVYKTRAVIRDLNTRLKVSIHTVESISKRIETLRDEELHPQLMELIQGLARMWRTMEDCHRIQKRAIEDAKLLIMSTSFPTATKRSDTSPPKPPRSATNLESELRHWRSSFAAWIASQRAYARALAAWAHRCAAPTATDGADDASGPPPAFEICARWARLMEEVGEAQVVDGLDFFASGIGSVYRVGEREEVEGAAGTAEKTAELAGRVLCAGMSVAVGNLTEFAVMSAEGYEGLGM